MGTWLVIYQKAGTIITLSTIVVWFLLNFGWTDAGFGMLNFDGLEGAAMEAAQAECVLAKIGNLISWIFTPLGWGDWKMTVAAITGLVAKENVVGTFGQLFGLQKLQKTDRKSGEHLQTACHRLQLTHSSYSIFCVHLASQQWELLRER